MLKKIKKTSRKLSRKEKMIVGASATTGALGATTAVAGESIAWAVFSAGPGAALTGICETNAFLAWLGGGALSVGGSGMAGGMAVLSAFGPVGWTAAALGAAGIGIAIHRAKKRAKLAKLNPFCEEDDSAYGTGEDDCHWGSDENYDD